MLYEITVPRFIKTLENLSKILDKSAAFFFEKKVEPETLFQLRLIADQFPLGRQIQIACDTAKLCASRLTGKDAPVNDDSETTLEAFQARIRSTISYLQKFTEEDFSESKNRHISQPRWKDQYMLGEDFVFHHAIPNFYFHVTTAYAILRHNGADIGKKDYLGEMPFKS